MVCVCRVHGLSYGVVRVILGLAVLVQYRRVTDGRTDGHTNRHRHDNSIYRADMASCSKKTANLVVSVSNPTTLKTLG